MLTPQPRAPSPEAFSSPASQLDHHVGAADANDWHHALCRTGGDVPVCGSSCSSRYSFVVAVDWMWFLIGEGRAKADQWSSTVFGGVGATAVVVSFLVWLWRQGSTAPATGDLL